MIKAAILVSDQLHRLGLQSLVADNFESVDLTVIEHSELTLNLDYDLYFIDSVSYVCEQDFFALRRKYCAVVMGFLPAESSVQASHSTSEIHLEPLVINPQGSLEQIIDGIGQLIKTLPESSSMLAVTSELSAREIQVLTSIVSGAINKEIAAELGISINTVLTHRKNITAKLGIKTVSGLTLYALMRGYIK